MIGWGIKAPNLRAWSLPNRQPLTANTLSFCYLIKTHLTQD
jgi:hypothetical protein